MKKIIKSSMLMLVITLMITVAYSQDASAKSSTKGNKVTYTLKKGTLTIRGKGKMPKSMSFVRNKKIKKVVIKNGITSVSQNAFKDCKNLKKIQIPKTVKRLGLQCFMGTGIKSITIPSSVKKIETGVLYHCKNLTKITMPGDFKMIKNGDRDENARIYIGVKAKKNGKLEIDNEGKGTINFNSPLNLENLTYVQAKNWNAWEKDKKYKSIDGVIYSKDGKDIVRVPGYRKQLNIAEGCTTFCLSSIFYGFNDVEEGKMSQCRNLETITIPSTVTRIEDTMYPATVFCENDVPLKSILVNSKSLDTKSILTFIKHVKNDSSSYLTIEDLGKMFPDKIKNVNGCYIMDETILVGYHGTNTEINVPQGVTTITNNILSVHNLKEEMKAKKWKIILPDSVKTIEENAFYGIAIGEINLPQGLEEIKDYAFAYADIIRIEIPDNIKKLGKYIFIQTTLEEAVLPDCISTIPEGMFYECQNLKKINVPKNLKTIEKKAFTDTKINVQEILNKETLENIGEKAFLGVKWQELVIPEYIQTIKKAAFAGNGKEKRTVTVKGNTEKYDATAFGEYEYGDENVEVKFEKGINQGFTPLFNIYTKYQSKKKTITVTVAWLKVQEADGYCVEVSADKNFKKILKRNNISKEIKRKTVKVRSKYKKVYARIRPYKIENNKKVYGRWTKAY